MQCAYILTSLLNPAAKDKVTKQEGCLPRCNSPVLRQRLYLLDQTCCSEMCPSLTSHWRCLLDPSCCPTKGKDTASTLRLYISKIRWKLLSDIDCCRVSSMLHTIMTQAIAAGFGCCRLKLPSWCFSDTWVSADELDTLNRTLGQDHIGLCSELTAAHGYTMHGN